MPLVKKRHNIEILETRKKMHDDDKLTVVRVD
jgi:hypothetical protein